MRYAGAAGRPLASTWLCRAGSPGLHSPHCQSQHLLAASVWSPSMCLGLRSKPEVCVRSVCRATGGTAQQPTAGHGPPALFGCSPTSRVWGSLLAHVPRRRDRQLPQYAVRAHLLAVAACPSRDYLCAAPITHDASPCPLAAVCRCTNPSTRWAWRRPCSAASIPTASRRSPQPVQRPETLGPGHDLPTLSPASHHPDSCTPSSNLPCPVLAVLPFVSLCAAPGSGCCRRRGLACPHRVHLPTRIVGLHPLIPGTAPDPCESFIAVLITSSPSRVTLSLGHARWNPRLAGQSPYGAIADQLPRLIQLRALANHACLRRWVLQLSSTTFWSCTVLLGPGSLAPITNAPSACHPDTEVS